MAGCFLRLVIGVSVLSLGCTPTPTPTPTSPPPPPSKCPEVVLPPSPPPPPPCPNACAPAASATASVAPPPAASAPPPTAVPAAIGRAEGGPRGTRRCEFRESVDTYERECVVRQNADGTLSVTAAGTKLNPTNGFSLRMGGGPNVFEAEGELAAFGLCRGPFAGQMHAVVDGAKRVYELRFREHCMIVIR